MNKKLKICLEKTPQTIITAFSLVEITVSMIVIAIILAVLTPIISKRLTTNSSIKNRISTDCDSLYPEGFCAMCYITPKKCITCTKNCDDNQYKNVGNCSCEDCSIKHNDIHCLRCNSKNCLQCDDGYYLNSNHKCVICPLGHYCYRNNEVSIKALCEQGTAAPRLGMSICDKCLKSDIDVQGSVAQSKGQTACSLCNDGEYASVVEQKVACEACPAGYYCPSGKLIPCPLGYTNSETGKSKCTACVKSTSMVMGSVAPYEGMTSCIACGNGSYAKIEAQGVACSTCPAGYYCPDGKIIPCPLGYYCPANSTAPVPCKSNQTSAPGADKCINCASGCSVCSGSASNCSSCVAGYYKSGTSCVKCPANFYCVNNNKIACPSGSTSSVGSTGETACKSTFDCLKYGNIQGNLCYKIVSFSPNSVPNCGSPTGGHTWSLINKSNVTNFCGNSSLHKLRGELTIPIGGYTYYYIDPKESGHGDTLLVFGPHVIANCGYSCFSRNSAKRCTRLVKTNDNSTSIEDRTIYLVDNRGKYTTMEERTNPPVTLYSVCTTNL